MTVGTKSVLFGVHQLVWHPITVALAWRKIYGSWPAWWQWVGILFHDSPGYWGKTDMDGPSGVLHPFAGARVAEKIVGIFSKARAFDVFQFCLFHSSTYARKVGATPSSLYLPDKCSLLYDPRAFYLFRARLSGEINEYMTRNPKGGEIEWHTWYKKTVLRKLKAYERLNPGKYDFWTRLN